MVLEVLLEVLEVLLVVLEVVLVVLVVVLMSKCPFKRLQSAGQFSFSNFLEANFRATDLRDKFLAQCSEPVPNLRSQIALLFNLPLFFRPGPPGASPGPPGAPLGPLSGWF